MKRKDQIIRRFSYLYDFASAQLVACGFLVACGACGFGALWCIACMLSAMQAGDWSRVEIYACLSVISGVGAQQFYQYASRAVTAANDIDYVPPVEPETPVFLPPEETLLRGSQAPPVTQQELLRPAGRLETPAEELLRATSESKPR